MNNYVIIVLLLLVSNGISAQFFSSSTALIQSKGDIIPSSMHNNSDGITSQIRYNQDYISDAVGFRDLGGTLSYGFGNSHIGGAFVNSKLGVFNLNAIKLFYGYKLKFGSYRSTSSLDIAVIPSIRQFNQAIEFIIKDQDDRFLSNDIDSQYKFNLGISGMYRKSFGGGNTNNKRSLDIGLSVENLIQDKYDIVDENISFPIHIYNSLEYAFSLNRDYGLKAGLYTAYNLDNHFNTTPYVEFNLYDSDLRLGLGYNTGQRIVFSGGIGLSDDYDAQKITLGTIIMYNLSSVTNDYSAMSFGVSIGYQPGE